jgi:hypothetical protein
VELTFRIKFSLRRKLKGYELPAISKWHNVICKLFKHYHMNQPDNLWTKLGFRASPFDTKPLKVLKSDVELLMGREKEQIDFLNVIDSDNQGVFVLSGVPGVGKTSFLNVQQYLLESGEADFGPNILAARTLCAIQPSDEPEIIARRCLQSYCSSIEEYCTIKETEIPAYVTKITNWIHQNKPATINIGFSVFGHGVSVGREVHLPSINETTFETFVEIIKCLAIIVTQELNFAGSFIVLDNFENLHEEDLKDCLTTFRDTLFDIPNIWWIIIGQSGLSSFIQSSNPKVFQRFSASLELKPISVDNLIKAVEKRVKKFHEEKSKASSPISKEIYLKLFESSNGEIRFVFKYCHSICIIVVQSIRRALLEKKLKFDDENFERIMGEYLIDEQIEDKISHSCLKNIITNEFDGHSLTQQEKQVLKKIGEISKVRSKDFEQFKEYGITTMQKFTNNYLTKLSDQNLLLRRQEAKIITYELRGISVFANAYDLLE